LAAEAALQGAKARSELRVKLSTETSPGCEEERMGTGVLSFGQRRLYFPKCRITLRLSTFGEREKEA